MNIKELESILRKEKIPEDMYSLAGGFPNEKYCIEKRNLRWEVYYSERGNKNSLKIFNNEDQACEYFYNWIKKTLKLMR